LPLDKQKGVRGSQYTSVAFGNRCKEAGVRPSTGSVGDAYDNAMCESFFATLECELIDRRRFRSHSEARIAVFQFIEGFYNPSRRHSALEPVREDIESSESVVIQGRRPDSLGVADVDEQESRTL